MNISLVIVLIVLCVLEICVVQFKILYLISITADAMNSKS